MVELFDDGENWLSIRKKINESIGAFQIADTDVLIAAGAVTSIPITTTAVNLLKSGDLVQLVDIVTGERHELTLSADLAAAATEISVVSYTFPSDIAVGSPIFFNMTSLLAKIY